MSCLPLCPPLFYPRLFNHTVISPPEKLRLQAAALFPSKSIFPLHLQDLQESAISLAAARLAGIAIVSPDQIPGILTWGASFNWASGGEGSGEAG